MKFCDDHWNRLREAIKARGLWELVSPSGEEAARRFEEGMSGPANPSNFDPLMGAHMIIVGNAADVAGMAVLTNEGCPLCFLFEGCGCGSPREECRARWETWIDKAADGALAQAKALGLVGTT